MYLTNSPSLWRESPKQLCDFIDAFVNDDLHPLWFTREGDAFYLLEPRSGTMLGADPGSYYGVKVAVLRVLPLPNGLTSLSAKHLRPDVPTKDWLVLDKRFNSAYDELVCAMELAGFHQVLGVRPDASAPVVLEKPDSEPAESQETVSPDPSTQQEKQRHPRGMNFDTAEKVARVCVILKHLKEETSLAQACTVAHTSAKIYKRWRGDSDVLEEIKIIEADKDALEELLLAGRTVYVS